MAVSMKKEEEDKKIGEYILTNTLTITTKNADKVVVSDNNKD